MIGRYERGGASPSLHMMEQIAAAFGISTIELLAGPPGEQNHSEQMPVSSILRENDTDRPRTVNTVPVPLYESIPAGGWDPEAPERSGDRQVLHHLVDHDGMVVVRVNGLSMYPKIMDGDLVLVDTTRKKPRSGDIIVALYHGETTLKRYRVINRQPVLVADNPEYPPIEIDNKNGLILLGVVKRIIDRDLTKSQI